MLICRLSGSWSPTTTVRHRSLVSTTLLRTSVILQFYSMSDLRRSNVVLIPNVRWRNRSFETVYFFFFFFFSSLRSISCLHNSVRSVPNVPSLFIFLLFSRFAVHCIQCTTVLHTVYPEHEWRLSISESVDGGLTDFRASWSRAARTPLASRTSSRNTATAWWRQSSG